MSVSKETKETIITTIDEVFKKMNSISWVDRQKAMKDDAFKNTEKILYCYKTLKEHVASEDEVIQIRYLSRKRKREGKRILEELYTYEEIAENLAGQQGYNDNLNERTVRNYKNTLIKEMAVFLFGSDAI